MRRSSPWEVVVHSVRKCSTCSRELCSQKVKQLKGGSVCTLPLHIYAYHPVFIEQFYPDWWVGVCARIHFPQWAYNCRKCRHTLNEALRRPWTTRVPIIGRSIASGIEPLKSWIYFLGMQNSCMNNEMRMLLYSQSVLTRLQWQFTTATYITCGNHMNAMWQAWSCQTHPVMSLGC